MLVFSKGMATLLVSLMATVVLPTWVSASSFSGSGTLTSANLAFNSAVGAWGCSATTLEVAAVAGGASATVNAASATGCTGTAGALNTCEMPYTFTGLPWRMTALDPLVIDGIHIVVGPMTGVTCAAVGTNLTFDGSLGGGVYTHANRTLVFTNAEGLTVAGVGIFTVNGDFRTDGTFTFAT